MNDYATCLTPYIVHILVYGSNNKFNRFTVLSSKCTSGATCTTQMLFFSLSFIVLVFLIDVTLRVASADPVVAIPQISTFLTFILESSNCPIVRRNVGSTRRGVTMICKVSS